MMISYGVSENVLIDLLFICLPLKWLSNPEKYVILPKLVCAWWKRFVDNGHVDGNNEIGGASRIEISWTIMHNTDR